MDSNTWQQGNLGVSTATGRSLEVPSIHRQQISVTSTESASSGAPALPGRPTGHWQRISYCSAVNGITTSQSHLHPHQQQNPSSQLRYFQVSKPTQYSAHPGSLTSGSQQLKQPYQQNFPQHYAIVASLPSSTLASNESSIPEISSGRNIRYPNKLLNRHNLSAPAPIYCTRFKILKGGHFLVPATGRVSLAASFALTNGINPFLVESATLASSLPAERVSLLPRIIPALPKSSLPAGFVNVFEAVPDMLRDIRPGSSKLKIRATTASFVISQEEFSYHVSKPRLSVRVKASIVARVETLRDKNWPELAFPRHRAVATIIDRRRLRGITGKTDKSIWKKFTSFEDLREQKTWSSGSRHHDRLQKTRIRTTRGTEKLKTYADAVQVSGRTDSTSPKLRRNSNGIPIDESEIVGMNLCENRRPSKMCPAFFHTSTPKIELRGVSAKREYPESCEEDTEHSSTSTASNGSYLGRSRTPESTSSLETAYFKNSKGSSSSSPVQGMEEDTNDDFKADGRRRDATSRRICKLAEIFCFGELANPAFFQVFDEYCRRRRRMSYTQQLKNRMELKTASFGKNGESPAEEAPLLTSLSTDLKKELFGPEARLQNASHRRIENSIITPTRINGSAGIGKFNGTKDQGVFRFLQKLKECPDGSSAIYTNSWRPEELLYLQCCLQDKNI